MLPQTSHRTERVLKRFDARTRPPRQPLLQPRDKLTRFELRRLYPSYDVPMSQSHDTLMKREKDLAAWLTSVAREKKRLYGWTTEETIDHSSIDRSTWYRWKKISRPGNMPLARNMDQFCESLGLDPNIPYGILGWGRPAYTPKHIEQPEPESELDRRIQLLRMAIERPGIEAEERQELEVQLVRLKATQRMNKDAIRAADKALKKHGAA